jgi:hypothetical protein
LDFGVEERKEEAWVGVGLVEEEEGPLAITQGPPRAVGGRGPKGKKRREEGVRWGSGNGKTDEIRVSQGGDGKQ